MTLLTFSGTPMLVSETEVALNIATNPSFERDDDFPYELERNFITCPLVELGSPYWSTGNPTVVGVEAIDDGAGELYFKGTRTTTAAYSLRVGFNATPLTPGPYEALIEARGDDGFVRMTVRTGTSTTAVEQIDHTLTSEWTLLRVPFTVSTAGNYSIAGVSTSGLVGASFELRRAAIVRPGGRYINGSMTGEGDFFYDWFSGVPNRSVSRYSARYQVPDWAGAHISTEWFVSGTRSARVPPGSSWGMYLPENQLWTVLVTARDIGQEFGLGEVVKTATSSFETMRITTTGNYLVLAPGWWDNLLVVAGEYDGPYFDGDTPSTYTEIIGWTGTPHQAESRWIHREFEFPKYVEPILVVGYESTRAARAIVHEILDNTAPSVVLRAAASRSGKLRLIFDNEEDAYGAERAHAESGYWTLTDPDRPSLNMTYVVADGDIVRTLDPETRTIWVLEIPFVEVQL
ncbi:hypothetical protein [Agromyces atrinae]|uniref:Uncharacterized protein n=1 Tax=Agromyces atrinae TaxID=592376 RepID=A0A4Q2M2X5_9MICO|nr:hypothetical protein [Agromyces atrinae]NYD65983.1 hypothetical protein [Agromyces atrinae]RXZ86315.1 hypothetical protein ESP50_11195 [Agromyces atrinae]